MVMVWRKNIGHLWRRYRVHFIVVCSSQGCMEASWPEMACDSAVEREAEVD